MIVFLNGQWVPEERAVISVFDRSFLYGDGLFETVRVANGKPFRWADHMTRLSQGAAYLGIRLPYSPGELAQASMDLLRLNGTSEALLRLTLSRGRGPRGYSPRGADRPGMVISCHPAEPLAPAPHQWTLATSSHRLSTATPIHRWKTGNKLLQVLARQEAEDHNANDALLLNDGGAVCETASGNLFWLEHDQLITPPIEAGVLPGITRAVVLDLAARRGLPVVERTAPPGDLTRADGAFATLSSLGLVEVISVDGLPIKPSRHTSGLYQDYRQRLASETA